MKTIPPSTRDALSAPAAQTSICLLVIRRDDVIVGLTDSSRDVTFDGYLFRCSPGLRFEQLTQSADLAPDHGTLITASSASGLDTDDIAAGAYEDAHAEIWRVDGDNPEHRNMLSLGTIGELTSNGDRIEIEFRSTKHALSRTTARIYQKSCDARLGDAACGVDVEALAVPGTIDLHDGLNVEVANTCPCDPQLLIGGTLRVEEGEFAGLRARIRVAEASPSGVILTLWQSPTVTLPIATSVRLYRGCDKSLTVCRNIFDNAERFRGFPTIPGTNVLAIAG